MKIHLNSDLNQNLFSWIRFVLTITGFQQQPAISGLGKALKNPGLFSDIDQISFDTHQPPPKDDIWKND